MSLARPLTQAEALRWRVDARRDGWRDTAYEETPGASMKWVMRKGERLWACVFARPQLDSGQVTTWDQAGWKRRQQPSVPYIPWEFA